jgi:hypothetical protein
MKTVWWESVKGSLGRLVGGWEYNIKMELKIIECE